MIYWIGFALLSISAYLGNWELWALGLLCVSETLAIGLKEMYEEQLALLEAHGIRK